MLIISNFLLWVVVLLQAVALIAVTRQIRRHGYGIGNIFKTYRHTRPQTDIGSLQTAPVLPSQGVTLLVYIPEECSIGRQLSEDAHLMAKAENMHLVIARNGQEVHPWTATHNRPIAPKGKNDASLANRKKVQKQNSSLPYAMIIDQSSIVIAQGDVSSRGDLVQLLASITPPMMEDNIKPLPHDSQSTQKAAIAG